MNYIREGASPKEGPMRNMYLRRLAAGLCQACGERPHRINRKTCQDCVDVTKAKNKERYAARKANSICVMCGIAPTAKGIYCDPCKIKAKAFDKLNTQRRKAYGTKHNLCHDCNKHPPEPGRTYCLDCLAERKCGRFKITKEQLLSYGNKCKLCGLQPETVMDLHVDHDHKTGKVRGLLCNNCNTGIGLLKESPDILRNAIKYLGYDPDPDDSPEYGLSTCVH